MPFGRKRRLWAIAAVVLCALIAVTVYVLFEMFPGDYFRAEFYPDTALVRQPGEKIADWRFGEAQGRITLRLSRGCPAPPSWFSTAHPWSERLTIELPAWPPKGKADLTELRARAGFTSYHYRTGWGTGDGGIRGHLNVLSSGANRIEAEYEITVDAYCPPDGFLMRDKHRVVTFQGHSVFRREERPEGNVRAATGELFPTPVGK
jgi:hypothetical protein